MARTETCTAVVSGMVFAGRLWWELGWILERCDGHQTARVTRPALMHNEVVNYQSNSICSPCHDGTCGIALIGIGSWLFGSLRGRPGL